MAEHFSPDALLVDAVVVHDVPLPREALEPRLTDAVVGLDDELREYFKGKVIDSLKARGLEVEADPGESDVVRKSCQRIVRDEKESVEQSKELARHLYAVQSNINSPGLLAIVQGQVGARRAVALLKLERERGVRARLSMKEGRTIIDLTYLRDLTLTDKTKVFKTAVVMFDDIRSAESLYGLASDDQRGRQHGDDVARFFLCNFLGCRLRATPDKTTLAFFEATERFINEDVTGPEKQGRYHVALLAAVQDTARDLSPRGFAERSLENSDRAAFRRALKKGGVDPQQTFEKGIDLVKKRLDGFRIVFESGMTLVGRRGDLEEKVDLPQKRQDNTVIKDALRRLQGR